MLLGQTDPVFRFIVHIRTVAHNPHCCFGRRPWEANSFSAIQKYPEFYGTQLFITVFTKAPYLPYPKADESSPHPSYSFNFHFNIIFSNYILVFQAVSFPQAFLPKHYMHFFSSLYATWPANLLLFDFVIRIIVGDECPEVPHCAVLSSLLLLPLSWQTHISSSARCFRTPSVFIKDQVSHPYKTRGKITVVNILMFVFLGSKRKVKKWLCGLSFYVSSLENAWKYFTNTVKLLLNGTWT